MKIMRHRVILDQLPVDFFADPDGEWTFDELVEASGFNPASPGVSVGALAQPFLGHPAGSAVVADTAERTRGQQYVAIVECPQLVSPAQLVSPNQGAATQDDATAQDCAAAQDDAAAQDHSKSPKSGMNRRSSLAA